MAPATPCLNLISISPPCPTDRVLPEKDPAVPRRLDQLIALVPSRAASLAAAGVLITRSAIRDTGSPW